MDYGDGGGERFVSPFKQKQTLCPLIIQLSSKTNAHRINNPPLTNIYNIQKHSHRVVVSHCQERLSDHELDYDEGGTHTPCIHCIVYLKRQIILLSSSLCF